MPMADKWVKWISSHVKTDPKIGLVIPSNLKWQGCPDANFADDDSMPPDNKNLHVIISQYG